MEEMIALDRLNKEMMSLIKEEKKVGEVAKAKAHLYMTETDKPKLETALSFDLEKIKKQQELVEKQIEVAKRIDDLVAHLHAKKASGDVHIVSLSDIIMHMMANRKKSEEEMKE